jgi:hypothetical protein
MNKALFIITFMTVVFASALLISSSGAIHSSYACPAKSSSTTTSSVNPIVTSNLNTPLSQSQIAQSQPS